LLETNFADVPVDDIAAVRAAQRFVKAYERLKKRDAIPQPEGEAQARAARRLIQAHQRQRASLQS
jgi:hypothetical protein